MILYMTKGQHQPTVELQQQATESLESQLANVLEKLKAAGAKLSERSGVVVMVDFSSTTATEELMKSLREIPSLDAVGIRQTNFPSSWYRYLPQHVYRLDIREMNLSNEDCVALSKQTHVKWLGLIRSVLPENGIQTVCSSGNVEQLSLQETLVDDAAVEWLVRTQALQGLDLNGNPQLSAG